jgi:hypothetical protein
MTLCAVKPINSGEQITIAYTDVLASIQERKAKLKAGYDFQCRCTSCQLLDKKAKTSNEARKMIREWLEIQTKPSFSEWYSLSNPSASLNPVSIAEYWGGTMKVFEALKSENLESLRPAFAPYADAVARVFGAVGNDKGFNKWVFKATDHYKVARTWSQRAEKRIATYEKWTKNAESFKCWDTRNPSRKATEEKQPTL